MATYDELRAILRGVQWSQFHKISTPRPRLGLFYRQYYHAPIDTWFKATVSRGESQRPSINVEAEGHILVLRFIQESLYSYLTHNPYSDLHWSHLNQWGPVIKPEGDGDDA